MSENSLIEEDESLIQESESFVSSQENDLNENYNMINVRHQRQYLNDEEPDVDWDEVERLERKYEFPYVVTCGLLLEYKNYVPGRSVPYYEEEGFYPRCVMTMFKIKGVKDVKKIGKSFVSIIGYRKRLEELIHEKFHTHPIENSTILHQIDVAVIPGGRVRAYIMFKQLEQNRLEDFTGKTFRELGFRKFIDYSNNKTYAEEIIIGSGYTDSYLEKTAGGRYGYYFPGFIEDDEGKYLIANNGYYIAGKNEEYKNECIPYIGGRVNVIVVIEGEFDHINCHVTAVVKAENAIKEYPPCTPQFERNRLSEEGKRKRDVHRENRTRDWYSIDIQNGYAPSIAEMNREHLNQTREYQRRQREENERRKTKKRFHIK